MKNILIIGNGFDLAHKLPTTYKDFLKFIKVIGFLESNIFYYRSFRKEFPELIDYLGLDSYFYSQKNTINELWNKRKQIDVESERVKNIEKMRELSDNNYWIKTFSRTTAKNGWVDFEAEISRVIQLFDKARTNKVLSKEEKMELDQAIPTIFGYTLNDEVMQKCFDKMLIDLNNLIMCLEIYLEDYVRSIPVEVISQDIFDLNIDCLLSFNYTDTFSRLYSCKNEVVNYDYIHGKSDLGTKDNNMVLGIDDYLEGDETYTNTYFLEFKKYFQRLHKKTGCVYKKWLEDIDQSSEYINVYIFGHSLAMTDKDVLREFINHEKTKITIYYVDEERYKDQITNLVHMIGPDKLNAMVYGTDPKLRFVKQRDMVSKKDSGWEIANDILTINNNSLSTKEIGRLCDKITHNAKASDGIYFHSQRDIINLYSALIHCYGTDLGLKDTLLEISENLYSDGLNLCYDWKSWDEKNNEMYGYSDEKTSSFIDKINTSNDESDSRNTHYYDFDDNGVLHIISSELPDAEAVKLFNKLVDRLNDTKDAPREWRNLISLMTNKIDMDWNEELKKRELNADAAGSIRLFQIRSEISKLIYESQLDPTPFENGKKHIVSN